MKRLQLLSRVAVVSVQLLLTTTSSASCRHADSTVWSFLDSSRIRFMDHACNRIEDSLRACGISSTRTLVDLSNHRSTYIFVFYTNREADSVITREYANNDLARYLLRSPDDSLQEVKCARTKSSIDKGSVLQWLAKRSVHWTACEQAVDCWDLPSNGLLWPTSNAYFTILARYMFIESTVVNSLVVRTLVCCRFTHSKGAESIRGPFRDVIRSLEQGHKRSLNKMR